MTTMTADDVIRAFRALPPEEQGRVVGEILPTRSAVDWEPDEKQLAEILRRAAEVDAGEKTYSLDEVKAEMREILRVNAG